MPRVQTRTARITVAVSEVETAAGRAANVEFVPPVKIRGPCWVQVLCVVLGGCSLYRVVRALYNPHTKTKQRLYPLLERAEPCLLWVLTHVSGW